MTDPYRYRCPEGHVNTRRNVNEPQPEDVESPMLDGRKDNSNRPAAKCYCRTCNEGYDYLIDHKEGTKVRP